MSVAKGLIHLVFAGDAQRDPCRRCGKHLESMSPADGFTLDPVEATCEVVMVPDSQWSKE